MNSATIDLRSIARVLGGDVTGGQVLAPGPLHSRSDRSLAIRLSAASPFGFVAHSHAGDDWRLCRDYVCERLGLGSARNANLRIERKPIAAKHAQQPKPNDLPLRLWREAIDPHDTVVERYLETRGLVLSDEIAGAVIRFHAACPWGTERAPAMLAAFRSIATDEIVAVHRTALTPQGEKVGRKMLGQVAGAAIKLDADADVTTGLHLPERAAPNFNAMSDAEFLRARKAEYGF
jgi:putative DNA primase/helicase